MSSKGMPRASKFRHVHGEPNRKDKCYTSTKANFTGDGNFIKANNTFLAFAATGGGGPVVIHPLNRIERFGPSPPVLNVHRAAVLDWDFSPFMENLIATGDDSGVVKITAFPEHGLTAHVEEASATLEGHQKKIGFLHWHPVANNILASSSYDNTIKLWDAEKSVEKLSIAFEDNPQSFEWNHNGSLLGVSVKDKTIRILDPRNSNQGHSGPALQGSKPTRLVWLEGEKVAVVGFSANSTRQAVIFDSRKLDTPITFIDIDQSAGVLMCFFDPDTGILFMAGKGDGNIRYYESISEEPYLYPLSEFRSNEATKGFCFTPKRFCDTKTCEIGHGLRLCKEYIEPISFQVPRKSDLFQEDLYPDTYAGIPALSADEFFEGKNKDAPMTSMKPGAHGHANAGPKPAFGGASGKTVASLEKELAELQHKYDEALKIIEDLKKAQH